MTEKISAAVLTAPRQMALAEFPRPAIGPEEGLLRVEMAGVCATDYSIYTAKHVTPALPMIMGHEILGRIEEIGKLAADRWGVAPGDRVVIESSIRCNACRQCVDGHPNLCDNRRSYGTLMPTSAPPALWGAYSHLMYLAPGTLLHRVPRDLPAEAAVLTCAVIANGVRWVRDRGQARLGQTVVVQGVGQQGLAAVVAARECGARQVVAVGRRDDERRLALARQLGATHTLNVDEQDVVAEVRSLTDGRLADLVVDVTGNPVAAANTVHLVRKKGRIVQAGISGASTLTHFPLDVLLFKEVTMAGALTHTTDAVETALALVASRRYPLEALVTHRFPLAQTELAIRTVGRELEAATVIKTVVLPQA